MGTRLSIRLNTICFMAKRQRKDERKTTSGTMGYQERVMTFAKIGKGEELTMVTTS